MNLCRKSSLGLLAVGWFLSAALFGLAAAQMAPDQVIELRIENRDVIVPEQAGRITKGDVIELRWTSQESVALHLHGYDIEVEIVPGEPASMVFEAHATGRFPVTVHGWGNEGHGHDALTYIEVYPR